MKKEMMEKTQFYISGLSYDYQKTKLLDNISFAMTKGEKLAILGANGSGKSLLLDGILGNIASKYTSNSFEEDKHMLGPYGILYDTFASFPLLKVREIMSLLSVIYNHPVDKSMSQRLGITDILDKQLKVLSKGENKKIGIYAALFFQPKIVMLDEPLDGLDPFARSQFWEIISVMSCTVIFTTHIWEEATEFADKILFIKDGKTLNKPASADELIKTHCPYTGKIIISTHISIPQMQTNITPDHKNLEYVYYFKTNEEKEQILQKIRQSQVVNYSVVPVNLKDVYDFITL